MRCCCFGEHCDRHFLELLNGAECVPVRHDWLSLPVPAVDLDVAAALRRAERAVTNQKQPLQQPRTQQQGPKTSPEKRGKQQGGRLKTQAIRPDNLQQLAAVRIRGTDPGELVSNDVRVVRCRYPIVRNWRVKVVGRRGVARGFHCIVLRAQKKQGKLQEAELLIYV